MAHPWCVRRETRGHGHLVQSPSAPTFPSKARSSEGSRSLAAAQSTAPVPGGDQLWQSLIHRRRGRSKALAQAPLAAPPSLTQVPGTSLCRSPDAPRAPERVTAGAGGTHSVPGGVQPMHLPPHKHGSSSSHSSPQSREVPRACPHLEGLLERPGKAGGAGA